MIMNHKINNPLLRLQAVFIMLLVIFITACTTISDDIDAKGTANLVIFPDIDDAWLKQGTYPNYENLQKINAGVSKSELYDLIGEPHFSEGFQAKEWDYIFNLRNLATNEVTLCQYKILFDKNMQGQSFFWQPKQCEGLAKSYRVAEYGGQATANTTINLPVQPEPELQPTASPIQPQTITVQTDTLFAFNTWALQDLNAQQTTVLIHLAEKILQHPNAHIQLKVLGHTDRLGDELYNLNLSNKRAGTIKQFLVNQGVAAKNILAFGVGESQPLKQCDDIDNRQALVSCLAPNRRVEIVVEIQ